VLQCDDSQQWGFPSVAHSSSSDGGCQTLSEDHPMTAWLEAVAASACRPRPPSTPYSPPSSPSYSYGAIFGTKIQGTQKMKVFAYVGYEQQIGPAGFYKTLGVAFTAGVASVEWFAESAGFLNSVEATGNGFISLTDLSGTGRLFPNGHVATVTFNDDVDMLNAHIDLTSFNTYIVQPEDYSCVPELGVTTCPTLPTLYFGGAYGNLPGGLTSLPANSAGAGFIVISGSKDRRYDVYAFAQASRVTQISLGFNHQNVKDWGVTAAYDGVQALGGDDSLGAVDATWSGGGIPTGTKLLTIDTTATASDCVGPCIDPAHQNTGMEDYDADNPWAVTRLYNPLVIVYGVEGLVSPCTTCLYVGDGAAGDGVGACVENGGTCAANEVPCYLEKPQCACDGVGVVGPGAPDPVYATLAGLCALSPSGDSCAPPIDGFTCFKGTAACTPLASTTCFSG